MKKDATVKMWRVQKPRCTLCDKGITNVKGTLWHTGDPFGQFSDHTPRLAASKVAVHVQGDSGTFTDIFETKVNAAHWAVDVLVSYFDWSNIDAKSKLVEVVEACSDDAAAR